MTDLGNGGGLTPPPYLSPSSIDTFLQCPLKYKLSRIDKLSDPPTEATTLGSFVHAVLEDLYNLPAAQRTIEMARKLMATQWTNEWQAKTVDVIGNTPHVLRDFRWRAWWCVENVFKMETPSQIEPDGVETELNDTINGVTIKGFIDRWQKGDNGIIVSDYKTGKVPRPQYMGSKFRQLLLYADVLATSLETEIEALELLYLKDGVRKTLTSQTQIAEEVASMRQTVTEVHVGVKQRCETGEFEPVKNKLCDWCSYKSFCPAWQK
jgi:putative RecB family exonuclease